MAQVTASRVADLDAWQTRQNGDLKELRVVIEANNKRLDKLLFGMLFSATSIIAGIGYLVFGQVLKGVTP